MDDLLILVNKQPQWSDGMYFFLYIIMYHTLILFSCRQSGLRT